MNMRRVAIIMGILCSFGLGILYEKNKQTNDSSGYGEVRGSANTYSFINPLLECDLGPDYISKNQVRPSKNKIEKLINNEIDKNNISYASVYYRDLNNGPWVGINEKKKFFPASLMKVPLMMHYYKLSETNTELLTSKVGTSSLVGLNFSQYFKPDKTIDLSKSYTVSNLIDASIMYSDNYATVALANNLKDINNEGVNKLIKDLHLEVPKEFGDFITVKDYATFFRVLFNSSYLDYSNPEKALKLLSKTTFNDGITKLLPKDIMVSHKFGEKEPDASMIGQIHDCGIVYVPFHPYIICVMTRGKDPDNMANSIAKISKLVYDEVTSGTKN